MIARAHPKKCAVVVVAGLPGQLETVADQATVAESTTVAQQATSERIDNQPRAQVVNKPATRMTAKKRKVLETLEYLGADFLEWGTPPYAVSTLAEQMGTDLSNLAKTMRSLEREGLVVRELAETDCWNAIAQTFMPRRCVSYWLAATMEDDKARAKAWIDGADERSERAFQSMQAKFSRQPAPVIDVDSRVLPQ